MKFYSELTKEMYDTIEALQTAEEKINREAEKEKEKDINEIFDLVKEASKLAELEKKILKKMAEYDQKYGFGSVTGDLLKKAGIDNEKFVFSFGPTYRNHTTIKKDSFNDLLKDFLNK